MEAEWIWSSEDYTGRKSTEETANPRRDGGVPTERC